MLALAAAEDESPLRAFELMLLRETGLLPELDRNTTTQERVQPGRRYQLQAEVGLVAAGGSGISASACQAMQAALDQHDLAALRGACQSDLPPLKSQLRSLLVYHLGSPPLRTRQMMLEVRRLIETAPSSARTATGSP